LQRPYDLSRVDHAWKIRDRKQRMDIRKYSFINRTIKNWNQLPAEVLGTCPCKPKIFKKSETKGIEVWQKSSKSAMMRLNGAIGNLSRIKPNERVVKCRWVKFK
jgi:hypothetical protein